jgi:hypothetical protein
MFVSMPASSEVAGAALAAGAAAAPMASLPGPGSRRLMLLQKSTLK